MSLFETTIRIVGGLLGAYELSKETIFLNKAKEITDLLIWSFNTSTIGIPFPSINLQTHKGWPTWGSPVTTLAEIGSLQLEFNTLSFYTKDITYAKYAQSVIDHLDKLDPTAGLYPLLYSLHTGIPSTNYGDIVTLGSNADSFYEYLLKQWLQSNKTENKYRILYDEAVNVNEFYYFKN